MARVTVEDCIDKVDSPYELVLVAKERATQLNTGIEPTLDRDNDKIQVSNEDLAELSQTATPDIDTASTNEAGDEQGDVSLDEVSETEDQASEQDTTNESENN